MNPLYRQSCGASSNSCSIPILTALVGRRRPQREAGPGGTALSRMGSASEGTFWFVWDRYRPEKVRSPHAWRSAPRASEDATGGSRRAADQARFEGKPAADQPNRAVDPVGLGGRDADVPDPHRNRAPARRGRRAGASDSAIWPASRLLRVSTSSLSVAQALVWMQALFVKRKPRPPRLRLLMVLVLLQLLNVLS